MRIQKKNIIITLSILILSMLATGVVANSLNVEAATAELASYQVNATYTLYEETDNSGYHLTNSVEKYSTGRNRLGTLTISSDCPLTTSTMNGIQAVGVTGSSITFSFTQEFSTLPYEDTGKNWNLSSDSWTSIDNHSVGTIGNGAWIVLKSFDGINFCETGASTVNIDGKTVTYTPDGNDIKQGTYYRFISAGEFFTTYKSGSHVHWIFWPFAKETIDDYSNAYINCLQVSTIYVASDTTDIGLYSKGIKDYDISELINEEVTKEQCEVLHKGISLTDGSVSTTPVTLDTFGCKTNVVTYCYNVSETFMVNDNITFTDPGKYTIHVKTKFGKEKTTTFYIFDPKQDLGFSQYFGDGFVDGSKRMYSNNSPVPVYQAGVEISVKPKNSYLPPLYGSITYYKDDATLSNQQGEVVQTFNGLKEDWGTTFTCEGYYIAHFTAGSPDACGEIASYVFAFAIKNDPYYAPSVNKSLFDLPSRASSLQTKVYTVVYYQGSGAYLFTFPFSERVQAESTAYEFEKRFVENYKDNKTNKEYYYYKSRDYDVNGKKIRYDSRIELTEAMQYFASKNVNITYANNTEEYGIVPMDKISEDVVLTRDIRVCINEETRQALLASTRFLNGFTFTQVANYEVENVVAVNKDSCEATIIPFGIPVENVLTQTGSYIITEHNWNGSTSYEAILIVNDEVAAEASVSFYKDGVVQTIVLNEDISKENATIVGHKFTLNGLSALDKETIVTIAYTGRRETCYLSELQNKPLDIEEDDEVTVTVINRLGNSFSFTLIEEGHTFVNTETQSDCLNEGSKVTSCVCGLTMISSSPALDHNWSSWRIIKEATIDAEGVEQRVCLNDSSHIETRFIAKLPQSTTEEFSMEKQPSLTEKTPIEQGSLIEGEISIEDTKIDEPHSVDKSKTEEAISVESHSMKDDLCSASSANSSISGFYNDDNLSTDNTFTIVLDKIVLFYVLGIMSLVATITCVVILIKKKH